jgi:hypothetical protein
MQSILGIRYFLTAFLENLKSSVPDESAFVASRMVWRAAIAQCRQPDRGSTVISSAPIANHNPQGNVYA